MGLAVGDALGAPFEFQHVDRELDQTNFPLPMGGGGKFGLKPGEWTGDTAQALMVVDSLLTEREFSPEDIALRLIHWVHTGPRHIGALTKEVVEQLEEDPELWHKLSRDVWVQSAGVTSANGSLVRCTPIALLRHNDFERMVRETILLCQVTHFDPRCVEACLAVNFVISQCLNNQCGQDLPLQARDFILATRRLPLYRDLVLDYDRSDLEKYSNFTPFPSYQEEPDAVIEALGSIHKLSRQVLSTSGYCVHTMQTAIWSLVNAMSFEAGVANMVRIGGDTNTQAALAGAMLGAKFGLRAIPDRWQAPLKDRSRIISLTEMLFDLGEAVERDELARGLRKPD